jgi:hypothetical protein
VRSEDDEAFIEEQLPGFEILGFFPSDLDAIEADRRGAAVFKMAPGLVERAEGIVDQLASL